MSLYDELIKLNKADMVPMHMPGHKRQAAFAGALPYGMDITEIEGFDNLHNREGILKDLADRLAKLKNAPYAIPLVGGSTVGILSAVKAMTNKGDRIIMARGCHKSVYHAAEICGLDTSYIHPETDKNNGFFLSVSRDDIEKAFAQTPDAKLVIITSPTYEGVISDIKAIADIAHSHGAKLLVDGAHGAHLGYSGLFPADALSQGADAVVESLHKTLPAMTQTAALYLGGAVSPKAFEKAVGIFETSSPSYVLMASIDRCVSLLEEKAEKLFEDYSKKLDDFYKETEKLENIEVIHFDDKGKIIISLSGTDKSGPEVAESLRNRFHIEPEMISKSYIICMTSICDTWENFNRLAEALIAIDKETNASENNKNTVKYPTVKKEYNLCDVSAHDGEYIPLENTEGRVSLSYLWAYPPGIPIVAPGEVISKEVIASIKALESCSVEVLQEGEADAKLIFVKA